MADDIVRDGLKAGDAAVVTGAGQGIGRAIALRLAAVGARIAVWDVNPDGGAETVKLVTDAGGEAAFFPVDVGDEDAVVAAVQAVVDQWGAPYALVNNAGIYTRADALDLTLDQWNALIRVNLTGNFICSRAVARHMIEAGRGAIIGMSSGRALLGTKGGAHYAVSKAGILSLTKTLALEWAPHGIRVNCIIPGVTETAMPLGGTTVEELRGRGARNPLGRIGQPEDLAGGVAFLLSPDAAYMTGQGLAINGGSQMFP